VQLSLTNSTCSLTNSGISSRCTIASTTSLKVNLDSIVNPAINLTLSINKVVNSLLTAPSSTFMIKTYYSDDTSLVDQLITGLTITATEVPLRSVSVTPTSYVVYANTTYTFLIQTSFDIPVSSIFKITFPS
jgi:hypothetical protein